MKLKPKRLLTWFKHFVYRCDPRATAMIGVTYFCQCNCLHCAMANYPKDKERELSKNELIEIINKFPRNKIKGVYFFGGEPLLRNDIFELISSARKRGFRTILDTNACLLDQETAKKLKKAGLKIISVSIDSPYSQIHNALRKKKNLFEKAINGIKYCLTEKITCGLSTYATKENLKNGDLKKIISLGKKLGVNYIRILPPLPLGKWCNKREIELSDQENLLFEKFRQLGFVELEGDKCPTIKKRYFYISPYGEIQPCCYIPFSFGNIKRELMEKILKRMWKHPMLNMKIKKACLADNKEFQKKYFSQITPSTKLPIEL